MSLRPTTRQQFESMQRRAERAERHAELLAKAWQARVAELESKLARVETVHDNWRRISEKAIDLSVGHAHYVRVATIRELLAYFDAALAPRKDSAHSVKHETLRGKPVHCTCGWAYDGKGCVVLPVLSPPEVVAESIRTAHRKDSAPARSGSGDDAEGNEASAAPSGSVRMNSPQPADPGAVTRWRVGTKLLRTLYRDEQCIGLIDTPEIAAEIVQRMNAQPPETEQGAARIQNCARCHKPHPDVQRAAGNPREWYCSDECMVRARADIDARQAEQVRKIEPLPDGDAAKILTKFPKCSRGGGRCSKLAVASWGDYSPSCTWLMCRDHSAPGYCEPHMCKPLPWLPALELAESLACGKGSSTQPDQ